MQNLLSQLSKKAIQLGDFEFTAEQLNNQWLGNSPANQQQITEVEEKLGVEFPADYKAFLLLANGFSAPINIEPSFLPVQNIGYLKNIIPDLIEGYDIEGLEDVAEQLKRSIIVAGIEEDQQFLLIPPSNKHQNWQYWKFANWIPCEEPYDSLQDYLESVVSFIDEMMG